MAYKLLSEPIRKYIRDKGWEQLRKIQAVAISKIMTTENNYILASRTASGKTEAAFLPILSKADFNQKGVQVLYISPLIALINDQFYRIEDLCEDLEISVTKWHGEAKRSLKKKLIQNPNGVVLITPESLEAMFVNSPYTAPTLFGNLNYIVIDEIHSFLGVDRGIQLMSILSRLQQLNNSRIKIVGLSATIGDNNYIQAKKLTGSIEKTKILLDRTHKETEANFKYFECKNTQLALELLKDLYLETANHKVLVFPNNRGRTEEVAVKLQKISTRVNGHKNYFSHHSSVDKEIRESIEYFAKNNERYNFCIACTSTLELGIDIGTVDKIVQIDATFSVASLVQRIGRSGRGEGVKSLVTIYATKKWSLLQSLACWNLYKSGYLEPIKTAEKPYDILLHQILSVVKQLSGCSRTELLNRVKINPTFNSIAKIEIDKLVDSLIELDLLEKIGNELIIGIEGEKIVNSRDFYSVFQTEPSFKVIHSGKKIGEMPYSHQIKVDENILLAAKIWKIKDVDYESSKIVVIPAKDGKNPKFDGGGAIIHQSIREEMFKILKTEEQYHELGEQSKNIIEELRRDFKGFEIEDYKYDCPVIQKESYLMFFTFSGTKINKTLTFLITLTGTECNLSTQTSCLEIEINKLEFDLLINKIITLYENIDEHLIKELQQNEMLISFSKWGLFLPLSYQVEILKDRYFDFEKAIDFIKNLKLIYMN